MKKILSICLAMVMTIILLPCQSIEAGSLSEVFYGGGPIRSMTNLDDGTIVGGRSTGHSIQILSSSNQGKTWEQIGTVANNKNINYGDIMLLAVPNSSKVFCAFREKNAENKYAVTVCRSDDNGVNWVYDSTVIGGCTQFVGAPWLFLAENGDLQCYYDSEPLATANGVNGAQWIAMQGKDGLTGEWNKYGVVAASRDKNAAKFIRDGMASVVGLGNNRIMVVTEGIEDTQSGGVYSNVVRAIQSFDGGRTWDYDGRRIVYQCEKDAASGKRYNAYCPMAIRVGGGPVGVVFCTDEDFGGTPDASNAVVTERRTHIKYVRTLENFETWGGKETVWSDGNQAYAPGMIETASNEILISIDHFSGHQRFLKYDVLNNNEDPIRTIEGGIEINGYQISTTVEGVRTIYSVDSKIDGKRVVRSGLLYGLADYVQGKELIADTDYYYIGEFESSNKGEFAQTVADSDIATSYAMTMKFDVMTASLFKADWCVRAFAQLEDGSYVYSKADTYVIYNIADVLYQGRLMLNRNRHEYLYNQILTVVKPDYEQVAYE